MAIANQSDFLGEGTGTGAFAPTQTPEQIAEAQRLEAVRRQKQIEQAAAATAAANAPYLNQVRAAQPEQARQEHITRTSSAGQAGNDWLYPGIVAGTIGAGILGAGAVGALGAGAAGTTAGGSAALAAPYAAGGAYGATTAATAAPALGAVGTMASPFPAAAAGAPAAAGVAGAAAPAAASWLTPATALGLGGLALDAGGIVASQIRTKAENDLIEKQKELAAASKARQQQVQREGMNRLGTQLAAFAPLNRAMQEMYGPGAGYSGAQMGALAADPGANTAAAGQAFDNNNPNNPYSLEQIQQANADKARQQQVAGAFGPPPQGPAPLQKRTPMPARKF